GNRPTARPRSYPEPKRAKAFSLRRYPTSAPSAIICPNRMVNIENLLVGGWLLGIGLYTIAQMFYPELPSRGDDFIRSTTDQHTGFRLNVFGYEKYLVTDKRRWKVWGKVAPAGYLFNGLALAVSGLAAMFWQMIALAELQGYAFAILAAVVLGSVVATFNLREPLEPSDLPKERIGDPADDPVDNPDDFNRML